MGKLRDGVMKRGSTWSYVIRVADPQTGQSRPRWVGGFPTEDAAKAARDEARVKARRGEYIDRNTTTVGEYLTEWLHGHALEVKPKTLSGYRDFIDRYVRPRIGGMRLQAVRPATLTKLYRELHESGGVNGRPLSARSVEFVHAILRKAFNDAVRVDELIPSNPAERAKRPKRIGRPAASVWTAEQLRTFLAYAERHRLFAFFRLSAFTGARRGELLNLRWADVDFDAAEVVIRGTSAVIDGARVEGTTKGGRERTVSLDAGTLDVQRVSRLAAGDEWHGDDYVFTTRLGQPVFPDTLTQLMAELISSYNEPAIPGRRGTARQPLPKPAVPLPPIRLHDLRHVHATMLLTAGVPVHVVAERLGHADPSITLRIYAHVIKKDAAGVADVFARQVDSR